MFDVLGALKSSLTRVKTFNVDNGVFRLHYRLTVLILLAFSILVTTRQYIGDPIDCYTTADKLRPEMVDQYCWVSSTHSVTKGFHKKVGVDVVAHGVDRYVPGDEKIEHTYYQWVCFVLFLQAMMFYLPHYLWKTWECGRLKALTSDLDGPLVGDDVKKARIASIQAYFKNSLHKHNFYVIRHSICELLNFVNVVAQMFITNRFLGGTFLTYGTDVINFSQMDQMERTDPMVMVFPRVTKCTFRTVGASGEIQPHDAICVLPVNIINEKIYIILWFWFIILAILSGLSLVYRLVTALSPQVRYYLLKARANSVDRRVVETITMNTQFGDWFLLYLLSKNVNSYVYKEVADVIVEQIEKNGGRDTPEKQSLYKKYPL